MANEGITEIKIFAVIIIKTLINKNLQENEIEKKSNIIQTRIGKNHSII